MILFTTAEWSDAILAGFDSPTEPGQDGGFSISVEDDASRFATLVINGSDGEVKIVGHEAIKQAVEAFNKAARIVASSEAR